MKRPDNIEDNKQCYKILASSSWAFCVQCDYWRKIILTGTAQVTFTSIGLLKSYLEFDEDTAILRCGVCRTDIDYLFDEADKQIIINQLLDKR